jgi:hypothetical protein
VDGAKSLDTVDVLAAFVDEAITLTVQSTNGSQAQHKRGA